MNHIELKVNGIRIARDVKDNVRLIDFLREELKLTPELNVGVAPEIKANNVLVIA